MHMKKGILKKLIMGLLAASMLLTPLSGAVTVKAEEPKLAAGPVETTGTLFKDSLKKTYTHLSSEYRSFGAVTKEMGPYDLTSVVHMKSTAQKSSAGSTAAGKINWIEQGVWRDANGTEITQLKANTPDQETVNVQDLKSQYDLSSCTFTVKFSGSTRNQWESEAGYSYMSVIANFECEILETLPKSPVIGKISSPTYGIEGNALHIVSPTSFAEPTDPQNNHNWYILINDGEGRKTAEALRERTDTPEANDDMQWIDLAAALQNADTLAALRNVYNINPKSADGAVKNQISLGNSDTVNDTLHIENLDASDAKSINGAFLKVVATSSYGNTDSNIFKLKIELTSDYYQSKEHEINWKYGLNGNGEIISLYTEDTDLGSIIDGDGILHIPAVINNMVVKGIGSGDSSHPVIPAATNGTAGDRTAFKMIEIPNTVSKINDYAFAGVSGKPVSTEDPSSFTVILPSSLETSGEKMFYSSGVERVAVFTDNLNSYRGFADCKNLKSVVFNGNTTVGNNCFEGCPALEEIQFNASVKLNSNAFLNTGLKELYIPNNVALESNCFAQNSSLVKLQIDTSEIKAGTFAGCTSLTDIIFDEHVNKVQSSWADNSINGASMYVKNPNTLFYGSKEQSPFGSSGTTKIYYEASESNAGAKINIVGEEASARLYPIQVSYEAEDESAPYFTGDGAVKLEFANGGYISKKDGESDSDFNDRKLDSLKKFNDGISALKDLITKDPYNDQTGISAESTAKLFIGEILDKSDVTVKVVGGANGGASVDKNSFFVMRDTDFETVTEKVGELIKKSVSGDIESQITDYLIEKQYTVKAWQTDIAEGDIAGTISAYAVMPYEKGVFAARFNVTVEKRTPPAYAYREYKSYAEIIKAVGEVMMEKDKLTEEVENYKSLLSYIEKVLGDSDDASLAELRDKLEEAQKRYDELSASEKTSEEGKILKESIDAISSLIDKGESIKTLKENLAKSEGELHDLEVACERLAAALHAYESELEDYKSGFGYVRKRLDGTIINYTVFIDGHEYIFHPSEDDDEYLPPNDVFPKTLRTAYIDASVDPEAPDLDGNGDGKFKYYCIGQTAYIIGSDKTYTKPAFVYIAEAAQKIEKINADLVTLKQSLNKIREYMIEVVNMIRKAGYEINVDDETTDKDAMKAIKDAIADIIKDYDKIREAISGEDGKDADKVLEDLKNLFKKISDVEEEIKKALAGTNGEVDKDDARKYEDLLKEIKQLKDNYEVLANGDLAKELLAAKAEIEKLNKIIDDLKKNPGGADEEYIKSLLAQIDALNAEIKRLEGLLSPETTDTLKKEIESLKKRIQTLIEQNAELKGTNKILEERNSTITKELESLRSSVGAKDQQILALSTENATLKAQKGGQTTSGGGGGSTTTTTKEEKKTVVKEECEHEWDYTDNEDGTHTKKCKLCKEIVTENHKYDELTKKCACGVVEVQKTSVVVTPVIDQDTCIHEWKYVDNEDGTHTMTCEKCNLIKTTKHLLDEDGLCECGYEEEIEEEEEPEMQSTTWTNSQGDIEPPDVKEPEEEHGFPWMLVIIAIAFVGAAGFLVYKLFLGKNKQPRHKEEDEDDEDDDYFSEDSVEFDEEDELETLDGQETEELDDKLED